MKLLGLAWFYSSESGLFNGLRRIQTRKSGPVSCIAGIVSAAHSLLLLLAGPHQPPRQARLDQAISEDSAHIPFLSSQADVFLIIWTFGAVARLSRAQSAARSAFGGARGLSMALDI
jgi:hypothetical protein